MKKSSIYRTAVKLQPIFEKEVRVKPFYIVFRESFASYKQFFEHYSNEAFFYLFFYSYLIWKKGSILSFEEINSLLENITLVSYFMTNYEAIDVECNECKGDGTEDCYNCNRGKLDCPDCDGEGEIDGEPCSTCQGGGTVECEICDGDGELFCEECSGTGTVESDEEVSIEANLSFLTNKNDLEIFEKAKDKKEKLPDTLFSNDSEIISWFKFPMPMGKSPDYEEGEEFPNKTYRSPEYAGKLLKEVFFRNGRDLEIYLDYEF
jgi:hypothetical protein